MKRRMLATCASAALVLALASGCTRAAPASTSSVKVPAFARVVLIVFENEGPAQVLGTGEAPTFDRLARRYAVLTNYAGVAHPSLPNYLALVSGTTAGITTDCTSCLVHARNLADTLPAHGRTWKTYAEGLPAPGFTGASAGLYAKRHDPFLYFADVLAHAGRRRRVVPLSRFRSDLAAHRLPDFSLVVPNVCHDMHNCSVATGDRWLAGFLPPLLHSPALANGVVFVVFDEGADGDPTRGGGRVPALVLGPLVRHGARSSAPLDHYSLLRTIEQAWNLPLLGQSATASPIGGIWRNLGHTR